MGTLEQYKQSKNIETNWIESIGYKANKLNEYEKQREEVLKAAEDHFNSLKNSFDSNAVSFCFEWILKSYFLLNGMFFFKKEIYTDLSSKEKNIEEVNNIGVKLIQLLKVRIYI